MTYILDRISRVSPSSLDLIVGTSSDSLSDLVTRNDGNEYVITEAAGVPGYNLELAFNINVVRGLEARFKYEGSATHEVYIQLYNYNTTAYEDIIAVPSSIAFDYRVINFEYNTIYTDNGVALVRFYHVTSGNASHDLHIDYVSLF